MLFKIFVCLLAVFCGAVLWWAFPDLVDGFICSRINKKRREEKQWAARIVAQARKDPASVSKEDLAHARIIEVLPSSIR